MNGRAIQILRPQCRNNNKLVVLAVQFRASFAFFFFFFSRFVETGFFCITGWPHRNLPASAGTKGVRNIFCYLDDLLVAVDTQSN